MATILYAVAPYKYGTALLYYNGDQPLHYREFKLALAAQLAFLVNSISRDVK